MDDEKEFYTTKDIADKIGVHVITIRRYIKTGKLKASRIAGRLFRISREDLRQFLEKE